MADLSQLSDEELQDLKQRFKSGGETVKGMTPLRRSQEKRRDESTQQTWRQKIGEERGQEQKQERTWSKKFDRMTMDFGNKATDVAVGMGLPPKVAGGVGAAADTAARVLPDVISGGVGGGLGSAAKVPLSSISKGLMASALKVPEHIGPTIKKTDELVKTLLDKGINTTRSGVEKLRDSISEIQQHIDDIIVTSNKSVSAVRAGSELRRSFDKFKNDALDSSKNIAIVAKAWKDFINNPMLKGKLDIPIQTAQEMKKQTYRALESQGAFERQTQNPVRLESKRDVARGLRKEIARAEPAIADWNAQEAKEIAALEPLERRVLQEMRRDPVGISLLAHSSEAMMGFVANRSSKFKSILANMLYNRGSKTGRNVGAGAGVSLFEIGKYHDEGRQQ